MMSEADIKKAADLLWQAEQDRRQMPQLSNTWTGMTIADAYAVQAEVVKRKRATGAKVIGYKIGLTSKAMQQAVQIDEPDYGHLYDTMMVRDGGKVRHADYCVPRIEVELTFVLGKPLRGPHVGLLDVMRATEYVVPSLEIIDARVQNPRKIFDTLADNGAAAGLVIGGRPVRPDDVDLRWVPGVLYRNSEIEETGVAAGVLGHPAMGIAWLANKFAPFGIGLEAGQYLLSGSFTRPVHVEKGDTVHAEFGPLGSVAVQFV